MSSATAAASLRTPPTARGYRAAISCWCAAAPGRTASQQLFGETVPLEARGPQMGVTEPLPYAIGPSIGVSSPIENEGLYFRQIRRGNIVFGGGLKGPAHADAIRAYVKPDNTLRQLRELRRFVPAFAQRAADPRLERHRGLHRPIGNR